MTAEQRPDRIPRPLDTFEDAWRKVREIHKRLGRDGRVQPALQSVLTASGQVSELRIRSEAGSAAKAFEEAGWRPIGQVGSLLPPREGWNSGEPLDSAAQGTRTGHAPCAHLGVGNKSRGLPRPRSLTLPRDLLVRPVAVCEYVRCEAGAPTPVPKAIEAGRLHAPSRSRG